MKEAIKKKMSMLQIVGYGSGCLGANLMNNTVSSFISFYYTEVAGLPIAAVGIIVSVLSQVLKHSGRDEHAFLISLAGLMVVLFWVVPYIYELFETMQSLFAL